MNYVVGVVLLVFAVILPFPSLQALDFQGCVGCHQHQKTLADDNTRYYLHLPFAKHQCEKCHTAQEPISKAPPVKKLSAKRQARQKINWLGESITEDLQHWFRLPADNVGETLIVELQGSDGAFSRREITVPLLAELAEVEDSGKPPIISNLQVIKVNRGVFLSVTIGWQTDTLADSHVRYGTKDLEQVSDPIRRFGRRHEVVLYKLQPDTVYNFVAVSQDLFGRQQVSSPLTFSTAKPFVAKQTEQQGNLPASYEEIGMRATFQRLNNDYILAVMLEQEASVAIGNRGAARQQKVAEEVNKTADSSGGDISHAGLSSKRVISLHACGGCHKEQNTATHPVNVYPKPGMTIPPEYPTLPDGRITCSSCHAVHGSDFEYLARKSSKRELCVGCHKDML